MDLQSVSSLHCRPGMPANVLQHETLRIPGRVFVHRNGCYLKTK